MKKEIEKLLRSIIFILMGLQIVFGIVWIGCNLGNVPRFEESTELLTMSETLCIDEYTGILYPLCIRGCMLLGKWLGLAGCAFLYVLQLGIAYAAYGYFLKEVVYDKEERNGQVRNKVLFFSAFIVTVPTILQCHMAILPYSLASSVFMVLLTKTVRLWRREKSVTAKWMIVPGILWVISALLCPDYAWLSGAIVVVSLLRYMQLHKKFSLKLLAVTIAAILCIGTLNACFQEEGSMGKIQKSVGSAMLLRFVWPNFSTFQFFWEPEVLELFGNGGLEDVSNLARLWSRPTEKNVPMKCTGRWQKHLWIWIQKTS